MRARCSTVCRSDSIPLGERNSGHAVVALHPHRVQHHRHEVVLTNGEHEVEEMLLVITLGERGVGRVGEALAGVELVGRAQQRRLERVPTRGFGTGCDAESTARRLT